MLSVLLTKYSGNHVKKMRWAGHVPRTEDKGDAYRSLMGRRNGKKPPERYRCGWEEIKKSILKSVVGSHRLEWSG